MLLEVAGGLSGWWQCVCGVVASWQESRVASVLSPQCCDVFEHVCPFIVEREQNLGDGFF